MAINAIELTLDLNPTYHKKQSVWCSQLDNVLRTLSVALTDGGVAYDVGASGYDVYIEGTKPDKKGFSYKVTDIGGTVSGSTVVIPLQTQMTACKGLVEAEIVLKSGDSRIGSANFWLMVEKAGLSDNVDTSTSELAPYLAGAQEAARIATEAAETAENVLDSIPSDYSELSTTVSNLSTTVSDISDTVGNISFNTSAEISEVLTG